MMQQTGVIITGASSGLGQEFALQCLINGMTVFGISRTSPKVPRILASDKFIHHPLDLSVTFDANKLIEDAFAFFGQHPQITQFLLINNAGTVEPIGLSGDYSSEAVQRSFFLNSVTPVLLVNAFIARLNKDSDAKIVNISSGAATTAYLGWGVYCASKAALNLFSEVVAMEHKHIKIVSIAPGVVDTAMQQKIRAQTTQNFPQVVRFVALYEQGQLSSCKIAAEKILDFIGSDAFGQEVNVDIRTL